MKYIPALALLLLIVGSITLAIMPSYLVSPSRSQTEADIALSHTLMDYATPVALLNVLVGAILGFMIWRREGAGPLSKIGVSLGVVVMLIAANFTRGHMVEQMFSPLQEVVRVASFDAKHVKPDDLVLGIQLGDNAAAYPLPIVGYHHIVNDRLGDEPFVVTY